MCDVLERWVSSEGKLIEDGWMEVASLLGSRRQVGRVVVFQECSNASFLTRHLLQLAPCDNLTRTYQCAVRHDIGDGLGQMWILI